MNRNSFRFGFGMIGAATVILGCFSAQSAVVYNSLASFNAAIQGGAYVENFQTLDPGPVGQESSADFSGGTGPISYRISVPESEVLYVAQSTGGNQSMTTIAFETPLTIQFLTPNITAVGGEFFATGLDENPANATISVTLNDGSTFNTSVNSHASGSLDYLGFTTTAPNFIQSITLGTDTGVYTSIDNLTVGYAAVPEPGILASLSALGLFGFGLARRAYRRAERQS